MTKRGQRENHFWTKWKAFLGFRLISYASASAQPSLPPSKRWSAGFIFTHGERTHLRRDRGLAFSLTRRRPRRRQRGPLGGLRERSGKELAAGTQRGGTASGSAAVQRRANRARGQRSRTRQQTTTVAPTAGGVGVDLRGWYEVLIWNERVKASEWKGFKCVDWKASYAIIKSSTVLTGDECSDVSWQWLINDSMRRWYFMPPSY